MHKVHLHALINVQRAFTCINLDRQWSFLGIITIQVLNVHAHVLQEYQDCINTMHLIFKQCCKILNMEIAHTGIVWIQYVPQMLSCTCNATMQRQTGFSPAFVVYGPRQKPTGPHTLQMQGGGSKKRAAARMLVRIGPEIQYDEAW